jgi:hypothetical protein
MDVSIRVEFLQNGHGRKISYAFPMPHSCIPNECTVLVPIGFFLQSKGSLDRAPKGSFN